MSNRWESQYSGAAFATSLGVGNFSDGDVAAPRVVQYLSYAAVLTDSAVAATIAAMGLPVDLTPIRNPFEFKKLPRLQCYLGSLASDQAPTNLTLDEVTVYWAVRLAWDDTFKPLAFGAPTFDSLLDREVRAALMNNHQLAFDVNGVSCPLARRSGQQDSMNYLLDIDEVEGRRVVVAELPWTYQIKTDAPTGRLAQIVDAGG